MTLLHPLFPSKDAGRWTGPGSGGRVGGTATWVGKLRFPAFTGKVRFACYHHIEGVWEWRTQDRDPYLMEIMEVKSHLKPGGD